jgi:hypothetical protein
VAGEDHPAMIGIPATAAHAGGQPGEGSAWDPAGRSGSPGSDRICSGRLDGVGTAVVAVEPASAHSTVLRKDAAMGQDGHACMASAATSRNSFSVAPLAA